MHEYSVVASLLARVEEETRRLGAQRVHAIEVRIGEASGIEIDLLRTAYSLFQDQGSYRDTELRVETVATRWACPGCDRPPAARGVLRCNACDRPLRLVEGEEIVLQRIEMEVA